jgi:hypothetical protein
MKSGIAKQVASGFLGSIVLGAVLFGLGFAAYGAWDALQTPERVSNEGGSVTIVQVTPLKGAIGYGVDGAAVGAIGGAVAGAVLAAKRLVSR